jgi:hypothetical protein
MTPAQREAAHQSIRTSQLEMPINELLQPIFEASPSRPHCTSAHLRKWGSQVKRNGIVVIIALRHLILRQKRHVSVKKMPSMGRVCSLY